MRQGAFPAAFCLPARQARSLRAALPLSNLSDVSRQGRVAAPSVCCAVACILLAAAPTAPPCVRRWRRASPLPLVGEPLAKRRSFPVCQGLPSVGEVALRSNDGEVSPLSCNQTVAFFTLFSKIKSELKKVLLKKQRICVTLHSSCNGFFGDSGVFAPAVRL